MSAPKILSPDEIAESVRASAESLGITPQEYADAFNALTPEQIKAARTFIEAYRNLTFRNFVELHRQNTDLQTECDALLSRVSQLALKVDCGLLAELTTMTGRAERAEMYLSELEPRYAEVVASRGEARDEVTRLTEANAELLAGSAGRCVWCFRNQPLAVDAPAWHVVTDEETGMSRRALCTAPPSPFEPGSPADYSWTAENIGSVAATERQMNAAEARILARQEAESTGAFPDGGGPE